MEGVCEGAFKNDCALSIISHSHHNLFTPWQRLQAVHLHKPAAVTVAFSQRAPVEMCAGWNDSWEL